VRTESIAGVIWDVVETGVVIVLVSEDIVRLAPDADVTHGGQCKRKCSAISGEGKSQRDKTRNGGRGSTRKGRFPY